uniref:BTB domain-containing protein n=1 Tax=Timema bartmani TaxID=61472 RepID=A0A7R9EPB5_9NEOP|nr:unnamed protein product [Timema bartmani]
MADGDTEQFSLRWNNFHSNLSSGFHALLQGEDLVDVTLAAGGNFVQAHKIVLSVCSPYFKELFKVNPCKHPIVIMKDVGHKELVSILEFMYRGEVNVRQEELASFLKTAESLQVKGLTGDDPGKEKVWLATQRFETNKKLMDGVNNWLGNLVVLFLDKGLQEQQEKPQVLSNARMSERELLTPPYKRIRSEAQASAVVLKQQPPRSPAQVPTPPLPQKSSLPSSPLTLPDESSQGVDFVSSMTHPKSEPLDYESDVEELDDSADNSKSESFMQLLGGESSQSHQDASGMGLLSSLPGISQDPNISQEGQGLHQLALVVGKQEKPFFLYMPLP